MCTLTPRLLPPSSVSYLKAPAETTANHRRTFSSFSNRSASQQLSWDPACVSLSQLHQNNSQKPRQIPSVTMSPVHPQWKLRTPNIRHIIDSGVCVLPTSSYMLEWNEAPVNTTKFYQCAQKVSSIPRPTPGDEKSERLKRCADKTILHSTGTRTAPNKERLVLL